MLVRSKDMVFIKGSRLRVDPVTGLTAAFEYTPKEGRKLPSYLVPADTEAVSRPAVPPGQAGAPQRPGAPTKQQLMAELSAAGIKFSATMKSVDLQALLDAAKKEIAPASSSAPSKENQNHDAPGANANSGTGSQDVI